MQVKNHVHSIVNIKEQY